ncbi:MAG: protein-disulfide isomerase [Microbacterium sp.]|jgi:protein-disulfide isomerase|uniref:Protein-disulfide isomerase n=1 Tax=Microbacterium ginsengisoli TaxID=400772 RepID=A0A0F0LVZ8_9MICO|nr:MULTISPECIES: thioredoxin domain-containing protein [Microbacterium]MAL07995.1 protein-disulfide isomerase [Microbacterium sp.]MCK9920017.1 thioredoxin domain-containing protein [Microbacteriaceae bacterium K1510]KJL38180.1 Serine/threonine-protein kinase PknE [Microbacterium ginsengisoli]MBN9199653.1 thioredoxin domain-containing protein [Microbacterium ginsengisoli]MBN9207351.1 thioredoxin domain-containing protein [Microbacterium ginsengisoli]
MAAIARKTNWFAIWVTVAVVVVIGAVAGAVVWMNADKSSPGTLPTAAHINTDTGAISVGTGSKTLDTWIDLQCPICQSFESTYGSEIQSLVTANTITLNIHPISILDRVTASAAASNQQYSTRAASAMYCVAINDYDKLYTFMQTMYQNQPSESSGAGLSNDEIAAYAQQAGATNSASCIAGNTYTQYVGYITKKTPTQPGSTGIGTPTIAINGSVISNNSIPSSPSDFAALITK